MKSKAIVIILFVAAFLLAIPLIYISVTNLGKEETSTEAEIPTLDADEEEAFEEYIKTGEEEEVAEDGEYVDDGVEPDLVRIPYDSSYTYSTSVFSDRFLNAVRLKATPGDEEVIYSLAEHYCSLLNANSRQVQLATAEEQGVFSVYTIGILGDVLKIYVNHGEDPVSAYITEV